MVSSDSGKLRNLTCGSAGDTRNYLEDGSFEFWRAVKHIVYTDLEESGCVGFVLVTLWSELVRVS